MIEFPLSPVVWYIDTTEKVPELNQDYWLLLKRMRNVTGEIFPGLHEILKKRKEPENVRNGVSRIAYSYAKYNCISTEALIRICRKKTIYIQKTPSVRNEIIEALIRNIYCITKDRVF